MGNSKNLTMKAPKSTEAKMATSRFLIENLTAVSPAIKYFMVPIRAFSKKPIDC
jgi:hypothetical protein